MNVQSGKNHIFMNVQSGENYIFMNVQLGRNYIFMRESSASIHIFRRGRSCFFEEAVLFCEGMLLLFEGTLLQGLLTRKKRAPCGCFRLPRNIIHARAPLLQIAANLTMQNCIQMLIPFGFRREMLYLCIAKRREPVYAGSLLFFWLKISVFYLRDRKFYL